MDIVDEDEDEEDEDEEEDDVDVTPAWIVSCVICGGGGEDASVCC